MFKDLELSIIMDPCYYSSLLYQLYSGERGGGRRGWGGDWARRALLNPVDGLGKRRLGEERLIAGSLPDETATKLVTSCRIIWYLFS